MSIFIYAKYCHSVEMSMQIIFFYKRHISIRRPHIEIQKNSPINPFIHRIKSFWGCVDRKNCISCPKKSSDILAATAAQEAHLSLCLSVRTQVVLKDILIFKTMLLAMLLEMLLTMLLAVLLAMLAMLLAILLAMLLATFLAMLRAIHYIWSLGQFAYSKIDLSVCTLSQLPSRTKALFPCMPPDKGCYDFWLNETRCRTQTV